jgi:hypothetical protein
VHNLAVMPAIQHLLQRWGFVKLSRYGLALTPEGRILSMRPAVLDDGTGARVVGWQDGDPAVAELGAWEPAKAVDVRGVASQVAMPPAAAPGAAAQSTTVPISASAGVMAVPVAPEPMVDEDDWEWTIALARARAAAEEVESAVTTGPRSQKPRTVPVKTRPMAGAWPKTEPIGAIDHDNYSQVAPGPVVAIPRANPAAPAREMPQAAAPQPELPPAATPKTVIPVPALPSTGRVGRRREPVVPTASTQGSPVSPRRVSQRTGPADPPAASRSMSPMSNATAPSLSVGDRTTPGIALSPAVAVQLPSVKRRLAMRR